MGLVLYYKFVGIDINIYATILFDIALVLFLPAISRNFGLVITKLWARGTCTIFKGDFIFFKGEFIQGSLLKA